MAESIKFMAGGPSCVSERWLSGLKRGFAKPVTGFPVRAPPEGKTFSLGVGGGTRWLTVGGRVFVNNISGDTLDAYKGPQFMSAGGAIDIRGALAVFRGLSVTAQLAPTRTILVDTTRGDASWGTGVRYSAGLSYALWMIHLYADAFQEQLWFGAGPADGNSTRTGVTIGIAFQP